MTATEVHLLVAKSYPSLGIATVYRAVNTFVKTGLLASVVIGGTTRYELAAKTHHHHFHCQECDRAFCLKDHPVFKGRLAPKGFAVQNHELVVSGACPVCVSKNKGGKCIR